MTPPTKPYTKKLESFEKAERARKEKKKNHKEHQREGSTLATKSNTENSMAKKCKEDRNITYYNYNKKGHYTNKCLELKSQKTSGSFGYLHIGNC